MKHVFSKIEKITLVLIFTYLLFDTVILAFNPFNEVAIGYVSNGNLLAPFTYQPHLLYYMHLAFCYFIIVFVFVNLHRGGVKVPRAYRNPYAFSIMTLFFVVVLNALFLFCPSVMGSSNLDYSIWGYSIAAFTIYQYCFTYVTNGMKPFYNSWIVENINQGVALFDYEDKLVVSNDMVKRLFPTTNCKPGQSIDDFTSQLGLKLNKNKKEYNYSFQFSAKSSGKTNTIRLDHKTLHGIHNEFMGQMLVFTDEVGDIDLLTAFYNWRYFKNDLLTIEGSFDEAAVISILDINALSHINLEFGRDVGDSAITLLSEYMRREYPVESYYVRGNEAGLIAIIPNMDFDEVEKKTKKIKEEIAKDKQIGCTIDIQFAMAQKKEGEPVMEAISYAFKSLTNKKLLDAKSPKSELIRSIVKTLEEVDTETEAHVKRTQAMGFELGKRLNFSDVQLSDLALLCLLHDIGKVGIPLNILNKPGKLNDEEWVVMKSHTKKGYQIAKSAKELSSIADMILHHHEKWDGTGYPDGLAAEQIPLLSRVISVVDSYDAMVSDRAYRKGMSVDKAIAELKRCSGTQFDPHIVDEFIKMLPEIVPEEIAKKETTLVMGSQVFRNESNKKLDTSRVHVVDYCRYLLDDQNTIVEVNEAFEKLTGYSKKEVVDNKMTQNDLIPEDDIPGYWMLVTEELDKNPTAYFEHRIKCKNGTIKNVLCLGRVYFDSAALAPRSEVIVVDTELTNAVQKLKDDRSKKDIS